MKIHTPGTIGKYIAAQHAVKYFRLIDANGATILPYNLGKGKEKAPTKGAHVKELDAVLNSEVIPDGVYFLQWKSINNANVDANTITIHKGKVSTTVEAPLPTAPNALSERVRSFDEALNDKTRIKELELENASLKEQLAAMVEAEDDTPISEAPSATDTVLSLLKEVGLPLLDKYFELKEAEVQALSAARPATQSPVVAPTAPRTATATQPVRYTPPPIVPAQNVPTTPPVQIVTGGGAPFPTETPQDPDEQALILFIQEAQGEELRDWYASLINTEDAFTVSTVRRYIKEYRPDYQDIVNL